MQYTMLYETGRLLRRLSYWLLMNRPTLSIEAAVSELRGPVRNLTPTSPTRCAANGAATSMRYSPVTPAPAYRRRWPRAWPAGSAEQRLDLVELARPAK